MSLLKFPSLHFLPQSPLPSPLHCKQALLLRRRTASAAVAPPSRIGSARNAFGRVAFSKAAIASMEPPSPSKHPVLLFDVMGTLVRDPFYDDVPAFFRLSMKELLAVKHPTAWIEFEKGLITEDELMCKFFKDKRDFDSNGLKACMASGYAYLEGIESLLHRLKTQGYQIHAFSNYPSWYELIEEKLKLSRYLDWTFVSCHMGKRKPDLDAFLEVTKQLDLSPSNIIFVDDQPRNVEAAIKIGMTGLTFQSAQKLENDLLTLGLSL